MIDSQNKEFRAHWTVHPGKEIVRTDVTGMFNLPYDTTAHYIAVHLHPFAESLELRDETLNQTVFKSNVSNSKDKVGLSYVEYYSDTQGIKLFKNHEYQIISRYNNTTQEDQDSMAVMYLYLLDKDFKI